ncbi:BlaI/MecI/CopY family transcriptional regulator [Lentzea sp. BCCO 10_0061]|nr:MULTISPECIES: BlaI/MecI/CopY family transcriptional regulator [Lentzea]MDX8143172.1 BlaI/MecI/CopY family transcriptional regulator [Lentzea sp. BCCO 10_0061]
MQGLGELESAVMDVLWRADQALTVREVLSRLNRELAYTTVMTVLDNLHRKGWVQRDMVNRAYQYLPSTTREESAAAALRDLLNSTENPEGVLLRFTESASEGEISLLRRALRRRRSR